MAEKVSISKVIAFRLAANGLTERADADGLISAAGRCGVQNSPPGSALLALHARVRDVTSDRVTAAVADDKTLLQTWSVRGAPFYFPTADAAVFTTGVLPTTEAAMRRFVRGAEQSIDRLDMPLTDVVELCATDIVDVLAGQRLAIDRLGEQLADRVSRRLTAKQRRIWNEEGPHAAGQPIGQAVVHFCLRILTLQQVVCFAPRDGNTAPFVLVDEWLDQPIPDTEPQDARAELVRRYLHCYGPSTKADFAAWLGVRAGDATPWWDSVTSELTEVEFDGTAWILTTDVDELRSSPQAKGVRLLPPRDPYTQLRDRETIVDKRFRRDVWKTVGEPGAVLADGTIVGVWRPRKKGTTLTLTVSTFTSLSSRHRTALRAEAEGIAPLRSASSVAVEFETF
ncbi:winged helix DNA-binding domain-containing protein [Antrihabitans cavernicola]|uniref:Winged helix DNA-binding domain-containing protein n=1 Tax=Antrihabitans cavernicola TaxID=2495913 RepID=A0A5A7SDN0_9NOCA|nr:winged helix DNA-binding domain-containing protein [Spelaeibacter cavernicola]KAA0022693.1 winged helix DNA-binding domain-containing protein [Spelaeibacter cavernicola]